MWDPQISALLGSPTVPHEPELSTAYENRGAIFRRVSARFLYTPPWGFPLDLCPQRYIYGVIRSPERRSWSIYPDWDTVEQYAEIGGHCSCCDLLQFGMGAEANNRYWPSIAVIGWVAHKLIVKR